MAISLEEAGHETPKEQLKSLRMTNIIERLNEELRPRIKTQGAWSDEEAVRSAAA